MSNFKLISNFEPTGDQPTAIETLVKSVESGANHQTLLGVTGSGKTFTMAKVIERIQKPTLIISHNKTLAAQLYQEFKEFFPNNAVHYFVSYYDYYQPEAYMPQTDTYIEKDARINDLIDSMRHASTASLLSRNDVIIIASVSCIYGIGDPEEYQKVALDLKIGQKISHKQLVQNLKLLRYEENTEQKRGNFRVIERVVEISLPSGEDIISVELEKGKIISLTKRMGRNISAPHTISLIKIFPAKHFVTPQERLHVAIENIKQELRDRIAQLRKQNRPLEIARLKQRTEFDTEMLAAHGYVNGIENYSRHLDFRTAGTPPSTLLDFFNYVSKGKNFLTFIDESHVTLPQVRGMYNGDRARKQTLMHYGFRLPSALDNRPLQFEEFGKKVGPLIYVSATPGKYELEISEKRIAEQIIRPTGILDPHIEIRPTKNQVKDIIKEIKARIAKGERSLVMALTKRLAEDIAEYLRDAGIRAEYLHSEIKTLQRSDVLRKLRTGECDVIVGINLLREGLDLPEVSFIALLDADKEGFLRNETTLLQIIGRAARHPDGKVILYADTMTGSIQSALRETNRRRAIQEKHNTRHGIVPQKIIKAIRESMLDEARKDKLDKPVSGRTIPALRKEMKQAAKELNFERAAKLKSKIKDLTPIGK